MLKLQGAIRKMHDLSINSDRGDSHKRARSLSPGSSTPILPSEALRSLRNVLREKSNEIQQLERKLKASEKQVFYRQHSKAKYIFCVLVQRVCKQV